MNRAAIAAFLCASLFASQPAPAASLKTIAIVCHCDASLPAYRAFEERLAQLGWDARTARIMRWFSEAPAQLASNAEQAVAAAPDIIFAGFTPAAIAIHKYTAAIPVVFAGVSDATEIGVASHLNRPEHNFTGPITMNRDLMPKRLELLKEAIPQLSNIGYLANPGYGLHAPQLREMEAAAQRLGVQLTTVEVTAAGQLEAAMAELVARDAEAVVVQQDPLFTVQAARVVALAQEKRLPAIYALRGFYDAGGFMWYGADIAALFRRAGDYVDRILKGATIAELPIERPAKLYLKINAKLARQLGIELNPAIFLRADEVIE
jgi:putative ABC transport system substrate-binding protein